MKVKVIRRAGDRTPSQQTGTRRSRVTDRVTARFQHVTKTCPRGQTNANDASLKSATRSVDHRSFSFVRYHHHHHHPTQPAYAGRVCVPGTPRNAWRDEWVGGHVPYSAPQPNQLMLEGLAFLELPGRLGCGVGRCMCGASDIPTQPAYAGRVGLPGATREAEHVEIECEWCAAAATSSQPAYAGGDGSTWAL